MNSSPTTQRARTRLRSMLLAAAVVCASGLGGCVDPLRQDTIDSLGDEAPGFEPSEIHRPGQPCLACHSEGFGEGNPIFSIAGTLFTDPNRDDPEGLGLQMVPNHTIRIIDSQGNIRDTKTNRCGNFYFEKEQFDPAYPLRAELFGPGDDGDSLIPIDVMASRIGRDGSCGSCHTSPSSNVSPDVVFVPDALLTPSVDLPTAGMCPPPRFAPVLFDPTPDTP